MNINDKRYRDPKIKTPSRKVVIIDENTYYFIGFPSFQIKHSGNVYELGVPSNNKIQTIFNSYTGRTFIFYDNYYYIELNECTMKPKQHGIINELYYVTKKGKHPVLIVLFQ
jgi:hypothetical protein